MDMNHTKIPLFTLQSDLPLLVVLLSKLEFPLILLGKSGHEESDEYNHVWKCSDWKQTEAIYQRNERPRRKRTRYPRRIFI
jgi:hypothetical protein